MKKNWSVGLTIAVFIILMGIWIIDICFNEEKLLDSFFGMVYHKPSEILTYIGVICGAIIVLGNLYSSNRRNYLTEKGQLDIRFKDAALLLASEDSSANISGIYALHQIALEASKDNSQKGYIKVIHDIFCSFIKDNSEIKRSEDNYAEIIHSENHKNSTVIQSIVNILFKEKDNIYFKEKLKSDLYNCVFENINFNNLNLKNVKFWRSHIKNSFFVDTTLENANFRKVVFKGIKFIRVKVDDSENQDNLKTRFDEAHFLYKSIITDSNLCGINFKGTKFDSVEFSKIDFSDGQFNNKTSFQNTIFGKYSLDEIFSYGKSLQVS